MQISRIEQNQSVCYVYMYLGLDACIVSMRSDRGSVACIVSMRSDRGSVACIVSMRSDRGSVACIVSMRSDRGSVACCMFGGCRSLASRRPRLEFEYVNRVVTFRAMYIYIYTSLCVFYNWIE